MEKSNRFWKMAKLAIFPHFVEVPIFKLNLKVYEANRKTSLIMAKSVFMGPRIILDLFYALTASKTYARNETFWKVVKKKKKPFLVILQGL